MSQVLRPTRATRARQVSQEEMGSMVPRDRLGPEEILDQKETKDQQVSDSRVCPENQDFQDQSVGPELMDRPAYLGVMGQQDSQDLRVCR